MNTTQKGNRIELKVVRFLESVGYSVEIARMSKGVFDRQCKRGNELRLIQVKGMAKPSGWWVKREDIARMLSYETAERATREVWRHIDHPGHPCNPRLHMQARLLQPDGSWRAIPLLPEWEETT